MADQKEKPSKKPDIPGKKGGSNTKKPDVPPKKVDKGTGVSTPLDTKTKAALKVFEFVGLPKIPKLTPAAAAGSAGQTPEHMDSTPTSAQNSPRESQSEGLLTLNTDNTLDEDRRRSPLDESRYYRRGQSSQDDGYNSEYYGGYDRDCSPRGRGRGRGAPHDPWDYYPRARWRTSRQ
jgi:hypothetical protein